MTGIEDARAAMAHYDRGWRSTSELADALRALIAEHERVTAPPTDDEREALGEAALRAYLAPTEPRAWSRLGKWEREKWIAAGSVGFRRQGPISDRPRDLLTVPHDGLIPGDRIIGSEAARDAS